LSYYHPYDDGSLNKALEKNADKITTNVVQGVGDKLESLLKVMSRANSPPEKPSATPAIASPAPTPTPPPLRTISRTVAPSASTFVPTAAPTSDRDKRLAALLSFSDAWSNYRNSVGQEALIKALHEAKLEDQSLLTEQYKAAIENLSRAEAIILAPKQGITRRTVKRLWFYVGSSRPNKSSRLIAEGVGKIMTEKHMLVTIDRNEAAVIVNLTAAVIHPPGNYPIGSDSGYKITATVGFEAFWSVDDSPIIGEQNITGVGTEEKQLDAEANALSDAAERITQKLLDRASP